MGTKTEFCGEQGNKENIGKREQCCCVLFFFWRGGVDREQVNLFRDNKRTCTLQHNNNIVACRNMD